MNVDLPVAGAYAASPVATDAEAFLSIAAVERDTGIPKDTLRVWERRYGFPRPARDAFGERTYPRDQLDKLRMVKRLLDAGHRPGKLVNMGMEELSRMGEPRELRRRTLGRRAYSAEKRVSLKAFLDLIQRHAVEQLRRELAQSLLQMGLSRLVTERLAPLSQMVGDAGMRGQLPTFDQRAFSESARRVLYSALANVPTVAPSTAPRVLLTTFAQEFNNLGILMAEAVLTMESCQCLSLGVQTPVYDIAQAAAVHRADIVVLSFSDHINPGDLLGGLEQLRQALPPAVEVWVCGHCPPLERKPVAGVRMLPGLESVGEELQRWRQAAP